MDIHDTVKTLIRLASASIELVRLPVARLHFEQALAPDHVRATYRDFTRRHPRFKIVRNKTLGIALIDLRRFRSRADYLASVNKRGYAGYHARRALARGYRLARIDRNSFVDDIHAINTSADSRQGRPMDAAYVNKTTHYQDRGHFQYYGVLNPSGALAAYCDLGTYGNFAATDRLLGRKNNHGVMYLLLAGIIGQLIDDGKLRYLMYDSYLGAGPGMRDFKRRLGFAPYRVRYSIQ